MFSAHQCSFTRIVLTSDIICCIYLSLGVMLLRAHCRGNPRPQMKEYMAGEVGSEHWNGLFGNVDAERFKELALIDDKIHCIEIIL